MIKYMGSLLTKELPSSPMHMAIRVKLAKIKNTAAYMP
jgi:hypothetical protein